jgi:uncharacterized protein (TIGR02453 family)
MGTRYFTPAAFGFLRELAANNDRAWWERNKDRYVATIREPALDFIADFGAWLQHVAPYLSADTRVNGGSLMRPHRDMRFAPGAPFKTNVGIHFRHAAGKDVHAPGLYLHLEPGRSFAGVGLWRPEAAVAKRIRQAIHDNPNGWGEAAHRSAFTDVWSPAGLENNRLRRVPRELAGSDHPHPDDLRLRSFIFDTSLTQKLITSGDFADELLTRFEVALPYMRFLCGATGVRF